MEKHSNFLYIMGIALALVTLVLAYGTVQTSESNTIDVTGEAKLITAPDKASISLSVQYSEKEAETAQSKVAAGMDSVIEALKTEGIAENDIQTSSFSVYPRQKWNPLTQESEQTGFTAVHTIEVKTEDISGLGNLVDVAIGAGANTINYVQFELSDDAKQKIRKELLEEAGGDARNKADAIAAGLGVKIGKVISASESGPVFIPYAARGLDIAVESSSKIFPQDLELMAGITVRYAVK